jgi:hypothetical protein
MRYLIRLVGGRHNFIGVCNGKRGWWLQNARDVREIGLRRGRDITIGWDLCSAHTAKICPLEAALLGMKRVDEAVAWRNKSEK